MGELLPGQPAAAPPDSMCLCIEWHEPYGKFFAGPTTVLQHPSFTEPLAPMPRDKLIERLDLMITERDYSDRR